MTDFNRLTKIQYRKKLRENRLTIKDKRRLGPCQLPKNITRPIVQQLDKEDQEETMEKQPRHSKASIIPNSFGPFIGRSKPCKRKIRQRNREDKVAQVSVKIIKTKDCIHSYAK
ncbi:hypothetical protein MJO29_016394, partial [Puccinia striiformis f. sp. tritici]